VQHHWSGPEKHPVSAAARRRRFGYRRLHALLLRDGVRVNRKKMQRLYTAEGLTVRRRKTR